MCELCHCCVDIDGYWWWACYSCCCRPFRVVGAKMCGGMEEQILEKAIWPQSSYWRVDISDYDQAFETRDGCPRSKRYRCLDSSADAHAISNWLMIANGQNQLDHTMKSWIEELESFKSSGRLRKVLRGNREWRAVKEFFPFFPKSEFNLRKLKSDAMWRQKLNGKDTTFSNYISRGMKDSVRILQNFRTMSEWRLHGFHGLG